MLAFESYHRLFTDFVRQQATRRHGKTVLDVGCGTGRLSLFFAEDNHVTGIDVNNNTIVQHANFTFIQGDAERLPFPDHHFDVVVSFDVIEHVEHDRLFVQEIYRVLQPGGELLLGTPNRDRFSHQLRRMAGRPVTYPLDLGTDPLVGRCIHLREYTAERLRTLAADVGFQCLTLTPFWFGLTPLSFGLVPVPRYLDRYCQYWFLKGQKAASVRQKRAQDCSQNKTHGG